MKTILTLTTIILTLALTGCGSSGGENTTALYIELQGDEDMTVFQSTEYIEHGATAYSQQDGEFEALIEGEVDTTTPNTYIINYSAKDSAGNTASTKRYVTVVDSSQIETTNVDVLALYSPGTWESDNVRPGDPETYINHSFAVVNEMYLMSDTKTSFTLVGVQEYNIDDTITSEEALSKITQDTNAQNIRAQLAADQLVLFRPYADDGYCGLAWINKDFSADHSVAHVSIDCTPRTIAHEIGHNLGLNHGYMPQPYEDALYAYKQYSIGHHVEGSFGTLMTYASQLGDVHENVFSNPDLLCGDDQLCGILEGEPRAANAAKSIREVRTKIAGYK